MVQRILVPLDGSKRAERALPVAARVACAGVDHTASTILLFRVANPSAYMGDAVAPVAELFEVEQGAALAYLREVAQRPQLAGICVCTAVAQGAPVARDQGAPPASPTSESLGENRG